MAADHSVMGNMLNHAIELVRASGRALVVEGVETKARLEALKAGGRADFAQGYGIARPMKIDDLARFFAEAGTRSGDTPPLVA